MLNNIIKVEDYEVEVGDVDWELTSRYILSRELIITVKKNNEVVLSSKGKLKSEFFNYLGFLINDKGVLKTIEQIYDNPNNFLLENYELENGFF
ncbi:hypothetical protein [Clostridium botulinum]|uniref:hypothetical protein n=1 Tax=Clostridium botulinum TaxID=1491 RepID=UPI0002E7E4EA|nr:hypothetical protein [Clostridium botulinum]MCD3196217.1 hypothetical protein [Clostridium botulinum C/D]MCD3209741.1 hypothetical protein [Clostridium botulinum C/D]MCD3212795.1 hypothetical protein [Clostridium botulinum C/D]MCD3226819.1 hypothetical protein [Clostridium botulinum C/D]MCD3235530.1 hypothetical protein [Clostridium botulinum C/D]